MRKKRKKKLLIVLIVLVAMALAVVAYYYSPKTFCRDVVPLFIINSDDTIRKDPFFYRCDGGLCFQYIRELEAVYAAG